MNMRANKIKVSLLNYCKKCSGREKHGFKTNRVCCRMLNVLFFVYIKI